MFAVIAIMGVILIAQSFDQASGAAPHFGWAMSGVACLIAAGGMF